MERWVEGRKKTPAGLVCGSTIEGMNLRVPLPAIWAAVTLLPALVVGCSGPETAQEPPSAEIEAREAEPEWVSLILDSALVGYEFEDVGSLGSPPSKESPEGGAAVLRGGGAVRPPKAIFRPGPDLSALSDRRSAIGAGIPVIQVVISTSGEVSEVMVLKGADPELEALLVETVMRWRYEPATLDGEPVSVVLNLSVNIHWQ